MYKLLNAGFYRLIKNKVFWGILIITLGIAGVFLYNKLDDSTNSIDNLLLDHIGIIGIFISIFTTLFVGSEYANGTIRNKIVVGHSRTKIYLSNLIISIIVGIIIELIYMLIIVIIGIPVLGGIQIPFSQFALILLSIVMIIITYSSIFCCITLLFQDITMSTVIGIIFVLAMFVIEGMLSLTANAEKYSYQTTRDEEGIVTKEIIGVNPTYPGETKKKIAQTILYIIPTGQANLLERKVSNNIIFNEEITEIPILLIYSLGTTIVINIIGIYCFNKKELK